MNYTPQKYDVAIIGGGLAGLSLSILLARQGYAVVLIEKEKYPFHKVCGEYISMESWPFLESLGVPLSTMQLPRINSLMLTAPNGKAFTTQLPLGGFGVSRYVLDDTLFKLAQKEGVTVWQETKVNDVTQFDNGFVLNLVGKDKTVPKQIQAKVCCGTYGKRSNLDVKWKRPFITEKHTRINNYIGVKYHVHTNWPESQIGLHNFKDGYCGISKIEGDAYCLCYLTTAANLKQSGNSILQLEQNILHKNPRLKSVFNNSSIKESFPVAISQISFSTKSQVHDGVLLLGDAAGMITPLCGNGMSMALHSSKLAAPLIHQFLNGSITRPQLEAAYSSRWQNQFSGRLRVGRGLQRFFGSVTLSNILVHTSALFPRLATGLIKKTHGKPF